LSLVADALKELGRAFPERQIENILELVAPLWVDPEAAARLVDAQKRRGGPGHVGVSCARPTITLRHYVDSAYLPFHPPRLLRLNGITAGQQVEEIAIELRSVLRPLLARLLDNDIDNDIDYEIDEWLAALDHPLYVAVALPHDPDVVSALRERFPNVTFIYHASCISSQYASDECEAVIDSLRIPWVTPPLDIEIERAAHRDYRNALGRFLAVNAS
jgi:hypothetical protein